MAAPNVSFPAVHVRNILFATDFSECSRRAIPYVTSLARKFGSSVHLCHVATPSQLTTGAPEVAPSLDESERQTSAEELNEIVRRPEFKGLNVKTILACGILRDELITVIHDNKIDLIVVGTHGRTGIRRSALGSAAEQICRIASCPVLTVGPNIVLNDLTLFRRILVPTDFSEESTKILPHVLDIAREYGATITLLRVIPPDAAVGIDAKILAESLSQTLQKVFVQEGLEHRPQFLIEVGHPAEAILRVAEKNKSGLIAIGIRRAFAPGIQLHSATVDQVMVGASCPVLTCR
jgi:nucleotide-binding universal stress UspA family protein